MKLQIQRARNPLLECLNEAQSQLQPETNHALSPPSASSTDDNSGPIDLGMGVDEVSPQLEEALADALKCGGGSFADADSPIHLEVDSPTKKAVLTGKEPTIRLESGSSGEPLNQSRPVDAIAPQPASSTGVPLEMPKGSTDAGAVGRVPHNKLIGASRTLVDKYFQAQHKPAARDPSPQTVETPSPGAGSELPAMPNGATGAEPAEFGDEAKLKDTGSRSAVAQTGLETDLSAHLDQERQCQPSLSPPEMAKFPETDDALATITPSPRSAASDGDGDNSDSTNNTESDKTSQLGPDSAIQIQEPIQRDNPPDVTDQPEPSLYSAELPEAVALAPQMTAQDAVLPSNSPSPRCSAGPRAAAAAADSGPQDSEATVNQCHESPKLNSTGGFEEPPEDPVCGENKNGGDGLPLDSALPHTQEAFVKSPDGPRENPALVLGFNLSTEGVEAFEDTFPRTELEKRLKSQSREERGRHDSSLYCTPGPDPTRETSFLQVSNPELNAESNPSSVDASTTTTHQSTPSEGISASSDSTNLKNYMSLCGGAFVLLGAGIFFCRRRIQTHKVGWL